MSRVSGLLIVEEDVLVRNPLAEYLRECGFKVAEAVDADEARQLLVKGPGGIEIVLLHAASEQDRGYTLASWIRSTYPEVQVSIAGTLVKTAENVSLLCEGGPSLTRPYDHKLVIAHIRRLQAARDRSKGE